jgi:hypothetical protein
VLIAALSTVAAAALALLGLYHYRRVRIAEFARRAVCECSDPRDAAFMLARAIFSGVGRRHKDPVFISSLLRPLGASPVTVLRHGGCCSGLHRLYITALDTLGIRSAQVTVLRRVDPAHAHCLVQVAIGSTDFLIDVDYGVWMRHADGRPMGLIDLQHGIAPVIEPFVFGQVAPYVGSTRTRAPGFPAVDYYNFDYELSCTANWAESALRRGVYAVLKPLTRGGIDRLLLPASLEWPELLLAFSLCAGALAVLILQTLATH